MSLLTEAMEEFVFMNKIKTADGYGGYINTWSEGVEFNAAVTFDSSITTEKSLVLEYHDVIKRSRDGKIFRITSDGDDKFTPASATLNMRQVTAEEWRLADG